MMNSTATETAMWQIFEVALVDSASNHEQQISTDIDFETDRELDVMRCKGYAPIALSVGDNICFDGEREFHPKKKTQSMKIKQVEIDKHIERDHELLQIARHSKGISFRFLLSLRHKFGKDLCQIIQNEPEILTKVPLIGPGKAAKLQRALLDSKLKCVSNPDTEEVHQTPSQQAVPKQTRTLKTDDQRTQWIRDWTNGDRYAVHAWFTQPDEDRPCMFCWNSYYAPTRKLIGKIENYVIENTYTQSEEAHILIDQSNAFRDTLETCHWSPNNSDIKYLKSAHEWISECDHKWKKLIKAKMTESPQLRKLIDVLLNEPQKIACIDTEFFVGKYEYNHIRNTYAMPLQLAIGRLYNIGIATPDGKHISILIKHPTLSLKERLNLFSSDHLQAQEKTLEFLRPALQHHIEREQMQNEVNVMITELDIDELNEHFEKYAIYPCAAWQMVSSFIEEYPYLMHHFSKWDEKLITFLAEHCGEYEKIETRAWFNTSALCHAVFPRRKVISHSLGYLSKRLCDGIDVQWREHLGGADAVALMQLLQALRNEFVNAGICSTVRVGQTDEKETAKNELYAWLENTVKLVEYYALFQQHGFEDDDMTAIAELTDAHLQKLGVHKKTHRLRILREAEKLNNEKM